MSYIYPQYDPKMVKPKHVWLAKDNSMVILEDFGGQENIWQVMLPLERIGDTFIVLVEKPEYGWLRIFFDINEIEYSFVKVYQHKDFPPGMRIYVDPSICEIHPLSLVAEKILVTCEGIEFISLILEDQTALIPAKDRNGKIYYVEPAYVRLV